MSYTPTIVVKKSDLAKHEEDFERIHFNNDDDEALAYLKNIYEVNDTPVIDGIKLLIFEPEFSLLNNDVRELLREWNIEYGISN